MGKKAAKKGKKGNAKRIPFPLLQLPTELIEIICEILKAQERQKSLATLNVANQFLREVTARYLWESVRWTPRTWRPEEYSGKLIPEGFAHTKHIMLVSQNGPVNEHDENGWANGDGMFWMTLFTMPNRDEVMTFGQRAHKMFPNLNKSPQVSAYVSDQNLIQANDTTALRRMIFDTLYELRYGKGIPADFTDIKSGPVFQGAKTNWAEFDVALAASNQDIAEGALSRGPDMDMHWYRSFTEYQPFRDRSTIEIDGVKFSLQMLTTTNPEIFQEALRRRTIDVPPLVLGIDFTFNAVPEIDFFEYLTGWLRELANDALVPSAKNLCHHPFDMAVQLPEQFTTTEFKDKALVLHAAVAALHAKSSSRINARLPVKMIVHGYPELGRSRNSVFAELNFSTEELAPVLCLGLYNDKANSYHPSHYFHNGEVVTDEA